MAQTVGHTGKGNTERTIKSRVRVTEHTCLSFTISFCSQKVRDPSRCEVTTHQLLLQTAFLPPVPHQETEGFFLLVCALILPSPPRHQPSAASLQRALQGITPAVNREIQFTAKTSPPGSVFPSGRSLGTGPSLLPRDGPDNAAKPGQTAREQLPGTAARGASPRTASTCLRKAPGMLKRPAFMRWRQR